MSRITPQHVETMLRRYALPFGTEAKLQLAVAEVLTRENIPFAREFSLGGDFGRIDFMADGEIGIECKVDGAGSAVLHQLVMYADCPWIKSLILVTSRHTHRIRANSINGKPLIVIFVGGQSL